MHHLLTLVEERCKIFDEGDEARAVLTNISMAFDCRDCSLLIAKLNVYKFDKQSRDFIYSCLITSLSVCLKVDFVVSL